MSRILSIVPYDIFPPKMGGQKGIALFNRAFCKNVELFVATTENNVIKADEKYRLIAVFGSSRFRYINPLLYFSIKKIIRDNQISHLLLEHPYLGWLGWLLKKTTEVKLVIHSHNIESERFKSTGKWWWKILRSYEKCTHRIADYNFFISDEDKQYAIKEFNLNQTKCATITYGFDFNACPDKEEKKKLRDILLIRHQIPYHHTILLFNGTLDYPPNKKALDHIIHDINPLLKTQIDFPYTILICGNRLPDSYQHLTEEKKNHIIYAGFVDDISEYFKGADIFINPVNEGGGIKTKLVEALGAGMNCVSTQQGAIGVPQDITNDKLSVVANNNWQEFVQEIKKIKTNHSPTPTSFYQHFFWDEIAKKAAAFIKDINTQSTL